MAGVRLEDVARIAGVSTKTVSNVVHGYKHVSVGTRTRVQEVIEQLGYRPNLMGRRLATGRTGLLALAFSSVAIPYFAELSRLVSAAAAEAGYRVLLEETDGTIEGERAVVANFEAGMVDGILFQPGKMSAIELARHRTDLPIVILGEGPAPLTMDRVMIDNISAAEVVTNHLLASGRRSIAFAGHEKDDLSATSAQRLMGYQNALEEAGIRPASELLLPSEAITSTGSFTAVGDALDAGIRFDAIVCRDDLAAIGALRALQQRGIHVPDDVALTGWDDIEMSRMTYPSITTVAPETALLARRATAMLIDRIGGFQGAGRHELVGFELAVRESAPVLARSRVA